MKPQNNDPLLKKIEHDIIQNYKCHTIILYGSRAREEATATSDYDILAIRETGELERDCRLFENFYLDIFIYSEEAVKDPDTSLIRIKDGIVLRQKDSMGDDLLAKIKSIFNAGPPATPIWEKHEMNTWVMKMLESFQWLNKNDLKIYSVFNFRYKKSKPQHLHYDLNYPIEERLAPFLQ
jgi:predicted nucleotidyltransferase